MAYDFVNHSIQICMNNLKKLAGKEVKNLDTVKGGANGKGTRKTPPPHQNRPIDLL